MSTKLGFSCFFAYTDPSRTMSYQMSRVDGSEAVARVCGGFTEDVLDTITGGIDGVGKGLPVYSVACGSPDDFTKQTPRWTYIASERDFDLAANAGGQSGRKSRAAATLNVRRSAAQRVTVATAWPSGQPLGRMLAVQPGYPPPVLLRITSRHPSPNPCARVPAPVSGRLRELLARADEELNSFKPGYHGDLVAQRHPRPVSYTWPCCHEAYY